MTDPETPPPAGADSVGSVEPGADPVRYEPGGARLGRIVVAVTIALSVAMGLGFYARYSKTLLYVKSTLDAPDAVHRWDTEELEPTACVDEAMTWAAGCSGIKSMCDMYVDQVIAMCMRSTDRTDYCAAIADESSARFGAEDCRLRGVARYVDAEACSKAYVAIVSYCRDARALADGPEEVPESARRESDASL